MCQRKGILHGALGDLPHVLSLQIARLVYEYRLHLGMSGREVGQHSRLPLAEISLADGTHETLHALRMHDENVVLYVGDILR